MKHRIGSLDEFADGACRVFEIEGRSIAVWNREGRLYALRNACPHMGAPLHMNPLVGTMLPTKEREFCYGMDGMVVRCPWHGYEFSLETGEPLFGTSTQRIVSYPVTVERDAVYLELKSPGRVPAPGA